MHNRTEIETDQPAQLKEILEPSLESDENVNYQLDIQNNKVVISVDTKKLGTLRACTDNVFRLSMLANKV